MTVSIYLFIFLLNCKQTCVDSSFVYLYLGKEKVGVFLSSTFI